MKTPMIDVQINRESEFLIEASSCFNVAVFLFACFIRVPSQLWFQAAFGLSVVAAGIAAVTGMWTEEEEEEEQ
jgi:hypothetical protein